MCPFGFSTKDLVSGMEDYCLQRRTEMLESIEKVENVRNVDDQIWNFSYYSDNDIINIRRFCRHLNIPKEKCPAFQNV